MNLKKLFSIIKNVIEDMGDYKMKQRVITAICIILVLIPIFILKYTFSINEPIYILGLILAVIAINEMISMKEKENILPLEIHMVSYISIVYLIFYNTNTLFDIPVKYQFNIVPLLFIVLALVLVMRTKFNINDASFILFAILYVGLTFHSLVFILEDGFTFLYIVLIAVFSDTFALFIGQKFGKKKLCPTISPKKTVEGAIGGTLVATIVVSIYAIFISTWANTDFMKDKSFYYIITLTIVLTILSQFGDLLASAMKRHFKIKDYGNIFPGHGGVLDRLDSILFTSLIYFYFTDVILTLF